jgi:hypothetical protein
VMEFGIVVVFVELGLNLDVMNTRRVGMYVLKKTDESKSPRIL